MTDKLQRDARLAKWLVTIPLALLWLLAIVLVVSNAVQRGGQLGAVLIIYLPMAFYLFAIVEVRSALARIAAGEAFAEVLPRMLTRGGVALFIGALLTMFGVPLLTWALLGDAYVRQFDPSVIALGVVGLVLVILGRLVAASITMRQELDQFI